MASAGNSERGRRQDDPGQGGGVGRGKAAEKEEPPGSGKSARPLVAKVVANPEVEREFATTENDEDFEAENQASGKLSGWRIERNANGFYRYRWQLKSETGQPSTYITSSGNTGYKRGSKYLPKAAAFQELKNGKRKRKKRH